MKVAVFIICATAFAAITASAQMPGVDALNLPSMVSKQLEVMKPVSGSPEAGVRVAQEWMHGYFKAPSDPISRTAILVSTNNTMVIQAKIRDQVCTLQINRQASINSLGWVVAESRCDLEVVG